MKERFETLLQNVIVIEPIKTMVGLKDNCYAPLPLPQPLYKYNLIPSVLCKNLK